MSAPRARLLAELAALVPVQPTTAESLNAFIDQRAALLASLQAASAADDSPWSAEESALYQQVMHVSDTIMHDVAQRLKFLEDQLAEAAQALQQARQSPLAQAGYGNLRGRA